MKLFEVSTLKKHFLISRIVPFIIFGIVILSQLSAINSNKNIIELNSDNLEREISKSKYGFIMFYSIDCSHCQAIDPIYEETAREYKTKMTKARENLSEEERLFISNLDGLNFYKLNSNMNPELMTKYKIDSVPTIVWFNREKDHYKVYDSETEMPSYFYDFALEYVRFDVPEINMQNLLNMFSDREFEKEKNVLLFVGDINSKMFYFKKIVDSAWNLGYRNLFHTNDMSVRKTYEINSNSDLSTHKFDVLIFKVKDKRISIEQFERMNLSEHDFVDFNNLETSSGTINDRKYDSKFDLSKSVSIKKIENLLKLFSYYPVNRFTHQNEKMISTGVPTLTLVHDYDLESSEYTEILNMFTRVAFIYRREIFFMIATKYTKLTQVFSESFRLYKNDLPALCMTSVSNEKQSDIDKFRQVIKPGDNSGISQNNIIEFIEKWKSMKLKNFKTSEAIPEISPDENYIHKLVSDNFTTKIEEQGKYVFLTLCSEKLDVCNRFRERLIRIANKMKNSDRIMIAEMDPYLNELDDFDIQYIPGVYLIPDRGEKMKNLKQYKGRLSTREIITWIRENSNLGDFEEISLPIEDILIKEEDLNEIKPIDFSVKGMSRKVYEKLVDPIQKEMWEFPNKNEALKEEEVLEIFFYNFFRNKTKDEL